ncbi:MFS family permease [Bradyrhizobium diazoefficiens]
MNSPSRVISFVNAGHFIDHYSMLIFAAAVIIMGPALGMAYSELLPYATPGFIAFGAGSLLTGWLGDRWSRRHMMLIFFVGIGLSMISVGFVQTPVQLGAALLAIGIFASIYHPVGTAMIVSYADRLGREMGINGVWGNLGVASSALVTGVIGQYLGWRFAFIVPGVVTILIGIAFAMMVVHEDRKGSKQAAAQARVAKQDMWRVILALLIVVIAISTTFNAVTVALPKLFAERLADLTRSPALLGVIAACVYVFGAMTQYTIGRLLDRYSLKTVGAAAVLHAGAVPVSGCEPVQSAADPGLDRHRHGCVRAGHGQRCHGRQIHHGRVALARLCRALFRRLHRRRRLRRPGRLALRAGRVRHHAARLRRALPARDRSRVDPAARDPDAASGVRGSEAGGSRHPVIPGRRAATSPESIYSQPLPPDGFRARACRRAPE